MEAKPKEKTSHNYFDDDKEVLDFTEPFFHDYDWNLDDDIFEQKFERANKFFKDDFDFELFEKHKIFQPDTVDMRWLQVKKPNSTLGIITQSNLGEFSLHLVQGIF